MLRVMIVATCAAALLAGWSEVRAQSSDQDWYAQALRARAESTARIQALKVEAWKSTCGDPERYALQMSALDLRDQNTLRAVCEGERARQSAAPRRTAPVARRK